MFQNLHLYISQISGQGYLFLFPLTHYWPKELLLLSCFLKMRFLTCLGIFMIMINKSRPEEWGYTWRMPASATEGNLDFSVLSSHIFHLKNYLLAQRKQHYHAAINCQPWADHPRAEKKMQTLSSLHLWLLTPTNSCSGHWEGNFRVGRKKQKAWFLCFFNNNSVHSNSLYVHIDCRIVGLLADIIWWSSWACGCYQQEQLCSYNSTKI